MFYQSFGRCDGPMQANSDSMDVTRRGCRGLEIQLDKLTIWRGSFDDHTRDEDGDEDRRRKATTREAEGAQPQVCFRQEFLEIMV